MPISIHQIRDKEFSTKTFGYSKKEVHEFMEFVASQVEFERQEIKSRQDEEERKRNRLADQEDQARDNVEALRRREQIIHDSIVFAERNKDEIIRNARKEAENIIRDAEIRAQSTLSQARNYLNKLDTDYLQLKEQKRAFLKNSIAHARTYLERLEQEPMIVQMNILEDQERKKKLEIELNKQALENSDAKENK